MKKIVIILAFTLSFGFIAAQQPEIFNDKYETNNRNILKANLTAPIFNTLSASYEYVLNKKFSLIANFAYMPSLELSQINYQRSFTDFFDVYTANIKSLDISTFSITPEFRIYLNNGYGNGLYLSPYFRYEKFDVNKLLFYITVDEEVNTIEANGIAHTNSLGLSLGYQWLLGKKKNIVIDWNIIGTHAGLANSKFKGQYQGELTDDEREDIQYFIDNSSINFLNMKYTAKLHDENSIDLNIKSPWVFLRSSVSIGIRF